jgi:hypothetical protein
MGLDELLNVKRSKDMCIRPHSKGDDSARGSPAAVDTPSSDAELRMDLTWLARWPRG